MAAIQGLRGTGDWGPDERPKDFREMIQKLNPNGESPLMGMLARAKKEKVTDPEYFWWNEPYTIWRGQLSAAAAVGATTLTFDGTDPGTTDLSVTYGDCTHLVPGDLLMYENISTAASVTTGEIIEVRSVISPTSIVVRRGASNTTAAEMVDNSNLMRIGNTHAEGAAAPQSATRNPVRADNYIQKFQKSYEVTITSEMTKTRTNNNYQTDKMRKSFDHSSDIELAFLFGKKSLGTGTNGKSVYTTDGIINMLPTSRRKIIPSAGWDYDDFMTNVFPIFDWKTPGGDSRVVLCGNEFLIELNKMLAKKGEARWEGGKLNFYGQTFMELAIPQGRFMVKTHPLLNRSPRWTKSAFVIDPGSLCYRYLRDTFSKDNIQGNDELDTKKGAWYTQAGLEVRYGGLTNMFIADMKAK